MNVLGEPPEGLLPDPRLVGLRVMLRIAVTSPVRSLPALAAHRQHLGATPAVRTSMDFGAAFEAGSGAFRMEPVRSVATIRRMSGENRKCVVQTRNDLHDPGSCRPR
jgi:hypothetical protein